MLRKLWWGQYSLVKSFWLFYVLGVVLVFVALVLLVGILIFLGTFLAIPILKQLVLLIIYGVWLGYLLIASVGVWRSADAYPYTRWWPRMSKCVVAIIALMWVYSLLAGGAANWLAEFTSR